MWLEKRDEEEMILMKRDLFRQEKEKEKMRNKK